MRFSFILFFAAALGTATVLMTGAPANATAPADDVCLWGFVWRETVPADHVCVTPDIRTQATQDNSQAGNRRSPGGGPYGPDTCKQGFVWREATPNDHVCVSPDTRTRAKQDNTQAGTRVIGPAEPSEDRSYTDNDPLNFIVGIAHDPGHKSFSFRWWARGNWDYFNIRWGGDGDPGHCTYGNPYINGAPSAHCEGNPNGNDEHQQELGGGNHGSYAVDVSYARETMFVRVQGCHRGGFLQGSSCTGWSSHDVRVIY